MILPWLIPGLAAVLCLLLSVFVFVKGRRTELGQVFVFLAFACVGMNLFSVVLYSATDIWWAFEATRVFRVGTIFVQPALLHLVFSLTGATKSRLRGLLVADYMLAAIFTALNVFDVFVCWLHPDDWGFATVPTPYYHILTVYAVSNISGAIAFLLYNYGKIIDPSTRLRTKFWIVGAAGSAVFALTNLLPVYGVPIYPPGNLGTASCLGLVAYGIVKHRLMDIDVFLTKGLAHLAVSIALVAPAVVAVTYLQTVFLGPTSVEFTLLVGLGMVALTLSAPRATAWTESLLESSLLRVKQAQRRRLQAFARLIVNVLDRDRILDLLTEMVREEFDPVSVSVFLRSRDRVLRRVRSVGETIGDDVIRVDDPFVDWIRKRHEPALKGEVDDFTFKKGLIGQGASELYLRNGWELCFPLQTADGAIDGLLALGRKCDLNPYVTTDVDTLTTVAAEASIALYNTRLNEELRKSERIINRADRLASLGTLAAGIAHEIRNPLVTVQTFFQLAPKRLDDEEFMSSFLSLADKEVARIRRLIDDLLSYSKAAEPELVEIDPSDTIDRVVSLLSPHAREGKVDLRSDVDDSVPSVQVDADQLLQAVINLTLNALEATDPGGEVVVSGSTQYRGERCYAEIRVADTGRGIPAERLEAIFDPFFTTKDEGTGLGLAITHRIIQDLGGFINVESVESKGSQFVVHLPAIEQPLRAAGVL